MCTLMEIGLEEEGLFRIAGSNSKVKKLKVGRPLAVCHRGVCVYPYGDRSGGGGVIPNNRQQLQGQEVKGRKTS